MAPGIAAGAMLAFVISLDDVVITEFVKSAGQDTLPTYMLGQLRACHHARDQRDLDGAAGGDCPAHHRLFPPETQTRRPEPNPTRES
jgi:hypothetical protein